MIKSKNILITGGAGFIGSNLFEKLIAENNYIVVLDNFNDYYYSGKELNIQDITRNYEEKKDYEIIKGDILDPSIYKNISCEIDIIFHIAALAGVRYSIENVELVTRNNVLGSINVFQYALNNDIKKIINASSSSVYGNPIYTPVDEEHPKNPISPYAVSKLSSELYADYYFREYNLPITSLRFYTVYGPRGRPDMAIRKFIDKVIHNKEIKIYGDGEQIRDFTFISDIISGLILSGEKRKVNGKVFNLGYSNPITINDLIDKIYKIAGKSKKVKYIEKQKGDVDITYASIEKAKKLLNYHPLVDIDEGLRKTYEWQIQKNTINI